ncbi:hypothetical protein C7449_104530 [Mycoplana dimorpha]|uniref:Uncharacterized protein n=1 Tax=Mycoplana dimorpha TaxID=28320 RepID=A0A2T5B8Y3_MYCDI|nr:hypothetical protein C7449_104530 [Mycoplana dimorpha]
MSSSSTEVRAQAAGSVDFRPHLEHISWINGLAAFRFLKRHEIRKDAKKLRYASFSNRFSLTSEVRAAVSLRRWRNCRII